MDNDKLFNFDLGRKYEYDIMRIMLTMLVVIGHLSLGRLANTDCGSMGNWFVQIQMNQVSNWIYGFHMYAFFFLSGCCFKTGKFETMDELVKNKFKRLVIPYYAGEGVYLL
ncbi:MAG: acyltransferase family protein [Lachnospiraceae bacterium]|nr:acyltransferase family protein [Lachnospiraceae bacterium]